MLAELPLLVLTLLIISILAVCAFEFVNGFHDTANAVATVIYTNSLDPKIAVIWSGFCNFLGVMAGGIGVAMGIVNLLPADFFMHATAIEGLVMILCLLSAAIIWNLATWALGLPASSSHTLIGSILGVGMAASWMGHSSSVNWEKAGEIGLSLLISPLLGFLLAGGLIWIAHKIWNKHEVFFNEPDEKNPPVWWLRGLLITTCTGVSFFHGSNDGQKGVGLLMLILMATMPGYFALNPTHSYDTLTKEVAAIQIRLQSLQPLIQPVVNSDNPVQRGLTAANKILEYEKQCHCLNKYEKIPNDSRYKVRSEIVKLKKAVKEIGNSEIYKNTPIQKEMKGFEKDLSHYTDYAPVWAIVLISLSLGLGTMIGWERIVITIGEKIGKSHMSYAQGAAAEMVASSTIGLSTALGLPVSTTHVLSSGVAGSMVAQDGLKNLQFGTVKNILLAWVLTLPVSIFLSGGFYIIARMLFF
ncbi:MAG: inorganic phosphate transporter [Bacteroidia bacterium]|nr:inorganic phosphate transporter [Bacteroidia bacterium]